MSTKRRWEDVTTRVDVGSERVPSGSHWMKAREEMFGGIMFFFVAIRELGAGGDCVGCR